MSKYCAHSNDVVILPAKEIMFLTQFVRWCVCN